MMAYTILLRNITPTQQQNIRSYRNFGNSAELAYGHLKNLYQATDSINQSRANTSISNNSTNGSSRDNIGSNIGSSNDNTSRNDNIGSSNDNIGSRNNNTSHH
ncbi:unnamed protein product [Closterium sp. NIES-54]